MNRPKYAIVKTTDSKADVSSISPSSKGLECGLCLIQAPSIRIRIFFNHYFFSPLLAFVHTYPVNPAYESETFLIRCPEWKFLNTLWTGNRVDAKSGYAKVSCIVNIVFQMTTSTHAQFPILPEESWVIEIILICVGYVWTGKFDLNADTCGKTKGRKKWEI